MKTIIILLLLIPLLNINAQRIGNTIVEKPSIEYPPNTWGMDIMFTDGGFGLGTFYRTKFSENLKGFIDLSFTESKDEREIEFINFYGQTYTIGKVNRAYLVPLNAGINYRLFKNQLTDNLRPYITLGIGPTFVITTPYEKEFFASFSDAKLQIAAGGYFGFGADFGISKSNLVGINFRYYIVHAFGEGIERLRNNFDKSLGGFVLSVNLGLMFD